MSEATIRSLSLLREPLRGWAGRAGRLDKKKFRQRDSAAGTQATLAIAANRSADYFVKVKDLLKVFMASIEPLPGIRSVASVTV